MNVVRGESGWGTDGQRGENGHGSQIPMATESQAGCLDVILKLAVGIGKGRSGLTLSLGRA